MKYHSYTRRNYKEIPQLKNVPEEYLFNIEVVGSVLPFKTNNYVVNELIDWDDYAEDPITTISGDAPGTQLTINLDELLTRLGRTGDRYPGWPIRSGWT